jgi:Domain of unknown function (DUF1772)
MLETTPNVIHLLTVLLVAVAFALSLAHALELPGKLRLTKDAYAAVQPIYYPGFTVGGFSEPLSVLLTIILLFFMPLGSTDFWLTLIALFGLVGMQLVYWLLTHPVNKFWLEDESLSRVGADFFALGKEGSRPEDWTRLRDRWEYSHVARAGFALVSFLALLLAMM